MACLSKVLEPFQKNKNSTVKILFMMNVLNIFVRMVLMVVVVVVVVVTVICLIKKKTVIVPVLKKIWSFVEIH